MAAKPPYMKQTKKEKVRDEMMVRKKVESILTEFETSEEVFRFLDDSHKRSQYQQKFDRDFYKLSISYIEKLANLLVLTNANQMFHLWAYRQSIMDHKKGLMKLYKTILKTIKDYETKNL